MAKVHGDNGGVSEKVFFDFDREYSSLKSQASAIAGKMRALKKRGEEDGLDVQEYEYHRKRRMRPLEERRKAYENGRLYLKFWKDPLGAAMNAIDDIKDEVGLSDEERQKKWEDEGYVVGISGGNRDQCPHPDPNSLGARFWMAGYDKGQAKNAPKKKAPSPEPVEDGPRGATAAEVKAKSSKAKVEPKHEPEVQEAKSRKGKMKGVTYWHNAELKKVYEIDATADAPPEGATNITKPEYERLKAEYATAEQSDWDDNAPPAGDEDVAHDELDKDDGDEDAGEDDGDEDEDEDPPSED